MGVIYVTVSHKKLDIFIDIHMSMVYNINNTFIKLILY